MIVPEESQYGGDTTITCDWGFNRNAKNVTFYRSTVKLPKEQLAKFELDSDGELLDDRVGDRAKYEKGFGTKRNLSLIIHDVLNNDAGPYWCILNVNDARISKPDQRRESGGKRLKITRR